MFYNPILCCLLHSTKKNPFLFYFFISYYIKVWFSNRRARLRKHTGAGNMPNMGPPMPALSMPQYSGNLNNTNAPDVHQVATHYDHLVQQTQHSGGYATGFHHNTSIMPQNYSGSVHFQPTNVDYGKMTGDDYSKYTADQLTKISSPPPLPPSSSTSIPSTIKSYADHMNESNWNQMYGHHQVYGPPNEYSQMQQNYTNPNSKYWS